MPPADETAAAPRSRGILALAAGCAVAGLILVAGLEIILRLGWIENGEHARRQVPARPEVVRSRVLVLGDSFILPYWDLGKALAASLAEQDVAVHNAAISGTGPFEYLDTLKRELQRASADVVLLSYYAGNDLTDVKNHPRTTGDDAGAIAINRAASRPVLRHLYSYHWLRAVVQMWRARRFDAAGAAAAGVDPELIEDARQLRINPYLLQLARNDPGHFLDNVLMEGEQNELAWRRVRELILEMDDVCRANGAGLAIVIFPHSIQVNRSHFDFFRSMTFAMDDGTLDSTRPQDLMRELCTERGIPLLDLLPVLEEHSEEELYLEKDDHLNPAGNALAAEHILEFLGDFIPERAE
ncbi:MAG TPA: hypothetical protein VKU85_20875 [bacterium]|nr:hypothetical protein [bacterium]